MSVYEYNELWRNYTQLFFAVSVIFKGGYAGTYNPVAMALSAKNNILSERIIPHFQLQYDLKPGVWMASFRRAV